MVDFNYYAIVMTHLYIYQEIVLVSKPLSNDFFYKIFVNHLSLYTVDKTRF